MYIAGEYLYYIINKQKCDLSHYTDAIRNFWKHIFPTLLSLIQRSSTNVAVDHSAMWAKRLFLFRKELLVLWLMVCQSVG